MAGSETLTIGSIIRHRGKYSDSVVYYVNNQVTMCGSVFQALGTSFSGIAPLTVASDKTVKLANTEMWRCIIDNIELYNATLLPKTSDTPKEDGKDSFSTGGAYNLIPTDIKANIDDNNMITMGLVNAKGAVVGTEKQLQVSGGSGVSWYEGG